MSQVTKEYIWSSFVTFVAAFATAVLPTLGATSWDKAAIFALLAVGIRAGAKALLNLAATKGQTVSSAQ